MTDPIPVASISNSPHSSPPQLERGLGLIQSIALNIANMVGVGPFISIPIFIAAMNGPQAMIAWVIAAVLILCDGLVWSELGAALPGSGGTYHFLRETFGRWPLGRLMPFLFIWQFLISGTLELATGYIGAVDYLTYIIPGLEAALLNWHIPRGLSLLAAAVCIALTLLLCRRIRVIGWLGVVWCTGTLITVITIIIAGLWHFDSAKIQMPPDAFRINWAWVLGLGAAMRIAVYDYLGYYNICNLGDEVRNPGRTIPRAVIISVLVVAALYLTMNIAIIGVIPWQEAKASKEIGAVFMERIFGRGVAMVFTGFIIWTAMASVFAMTLGYSRIPFAAALSGDFFHVFGRVHPRKHYPRTSLLAVGGLTAVFCFLPLQKVIDAAVVVRILVQFVGQIAALHILRKLRPDVPLPFRMWLYPIPSLLALVGWIFMFSTSGWLILAALAVIASGAAFFFIWQAARRPRAVSSLT